jgi:hypothetical protein
MERSRRERLVRMDRADPENCGRTARGPPRGTAQCTGLRASEAALSSPIGGTPSDWRSPSGRFQRPALGGPSPDFARRARPVVLLFSPERELAENAAAELGAAGYDAVTAAEVADLPKIAAQARVIVLDARAGVSPDVARAVSCWRLGRIFVAIGDGAAALTPDLVVAPPLGQGALARAVATVEPAPRS